MEAALELVLLGVMALSAFGFVMTLLAHVAGLLGLDASWGVHLFWPLAFVAFFPLWILLRDQRDNRLILRMMFRKCPPWMKWLVAGAVAYAILNLVRRGTTPETGVPPALPRGVLAPDLVHDFTAHLMAAYALIYAMTYAIVATLGNPASPGYIGTRSYEGGRRCRNGHPVPDEVYFCEECGVQVPE